MTFLGIALSVFITVALCALVLKLAYIVIAEACSFILDMNWGWIFIITIVVTILVVICAR